MGDLRRRGGPPARGDMRILHVKSHRRVELAASGDMLIFLVWWDQLCPLKF